jgi:large repetitive protein
VGSPTGLTGLTVIGGERQLQVSWQPAQSNGNAITAYVATASPGNEQCYWTTSQSSYSCTITGLTNGTQYSVSLVAQNSVGTSTSVTAMGTPVGSPTPVSAVTATSDNASSTVSWTFPTYLGYGVQQVNAGTGQIKFTGITFTVTASPGAGTCSANSSSFTFASTASVFTGSCTITGLTNGTSYTFSVTAAVTVNSTPLASSPSTTSSPVEIGLPQVPTKVVAAPANGQATVSWQAPSSGGPIASYLVTASPGGYTCVTSSGTSCIVTGLANNAPYTFTVVARNIWGVSAPSTPSTSVTPGAAPSAPAVNAPQAGNGTLTVSWTSAVTNGGAAIASYKVSASPGSVTCQTTGNSCVLSGLTNFTSYSITVVATNAQGITSPASAAVTGMPMVPPSVSMSIAGVNYRTVTVSVTATVPSGDSLKSVACNWGDGNTFSAASGTNQYSRTYGADGNWTISCTLTDNNGQTATSSVPVSEQAQHAVTLYNDWSLSGVKAYTNDSNSLTATMTFQVPAGVSALTKIIVGGDIWNSYEPAGEYQRVVISVNGGVRYQGTQTWSYNPNGYQAYSYGFNIGVARGDTVTIEVDARNSFGNGSKIADIFLCANNHLGASGDILAGELDGLS